MADIPDYIRQELTRGFTKESIGIALMQVGYTQQQVDEAFKQVEITPAVADRFEPRWFFHKKYILFTMIAFLIIILGVVGMLLISKSPDASAPEPPVTTPQTVNPAYLDCQHEVKKSLLNCLAWTESDESHCDELSKGKEECIAFRVTKQAVLSGDVSACGSLTGEELQLCQAFVQRSSSSCGSTLCIFFASAGDYYERHDTSLCSQFSGLDKGLCEAIIEDKPEMCREKLTDKDCPARFI